MQNICLPLVFLMTALIARISGNTISSLKTKRAASPNEYHFHFTIQNEHEDNKNQQSKLDAHGGVEMGIDYTDSSEEKHETENDGITEELLKKVLGTLSGGTKDKNIQAIVEKTLLEVAKENSPSASSRTVIKKLISNLGLTTKSTIEIKEKDEKTEKNVKKVMQVLFGFTQDKKLNNMIKSTYAELSKAQKSKSKKNSKDNEGDDYQFGVCCILDAAIGGAAVAATAAAEAGGTAAAIEGGFAVGEGIAAAEGVAAAEGNSS